MTTAVGEAVRPSRQESVTEWGSLEELLRLVPQLRIQFG